MADFANDGPDAAPEDAHVSTGWGFITGRDHELGRFSQVGKEIVGQYSQQQIGPPGPAGDGQWHSDDERLFGVGHGHLLTVC